MLVKIEVVLTDMRETLWKKENPTVWMPYV